MDKRFENNGTGMRISRRVLEDVCKRMIEIILFCLPNASRGTIYSVGPMPDLRTVRITTGRKEGTTDEITWGALNPSDYDHPGKVWDTYRDRPGGILEAMAWCVETQKSWTAEDPENNIRCVRKQLEGKASEDYHHMEPVLVRKDDLWDRSPALDTLPEDSFGKPMWKDSPYATVAVIKIHFLPKTIKQGDRSTRIIKELAHSLGTQMLSLHAKAITLEQQMSLVRERQETCNIIAHEFRNLVPRIGFAYRAINNEIAYMRESWEFLVSEHLPEKSSKNAILQQLNEILRPLEEEFSGTRISKEIVRVSRYQNQLMESCLLPQQNVNWLNQKIRPLWLSILENTEPEPQRRLRIEELLDRLNESFHLVLDRGLRDKIKVIPDNVKAKWVDLAYREINGRNNGMLKEYIRFLDNLDLDLPRKRHCVKNLIYLKSLVELIPDIEEKLNCRLEVFKNSGSKGMEHRA